MKLETVIIITKGICFAGIGATAPLATGLAQWADTGEWPPRINWVVIIGICLGSMFNSLLGFLSGSFTDYMNTRKANGNTQMQPPKP